MLYRPSPPEPETAVKFREFALLCACAAVGIIITAGAMWLGGLDIGSMLH